MRNICRIAAVFTLMTFVVLGACPAFAAGANAHVKAVQSALSRQGYHLKADGKMGPKTESALMEFQKKNGLSVTGAADAETRAKLGVK